LGSPKSLFGTGVAGREMLVQVPDISSDRSRRNSCCGTDHLTSSPLSHSLFLNSQVESITGAVGIFVDRREDDPWSARVEV
jgi:hypothetical protein